MSLSWNNDVVVVGASLGGCTAAALFARHGLSVALLERTSDPAHYKKVCTHFLQPIAMETLRKLGLDARIEAAGGRRNDLEVWTRYGWIRGGDPDRIGHGYNIRRQTLDPIVRDLAINTPGVSFHAGTAVVELLRDANGRVRGVAAGSGPGRREFLAPLVVAADGRCSQLARLAGVPARVHQNNRFTYFTYYRGVPLSTGANAHYWHLYPNLAYAFRNDDDTTLLGIFLPRSELAAFKSNPMGYFRRFWDRIPDPPRIGDAAPIGELLGITEIPNHWRPASVPGLAFVGDAAMALDPIWGTGCSYAFASADWMVEQVAPAFGAASHRLGAIDRGLVRYRKAHRSRTRWHYAHIASFSRVRPDLAVERLVFSAATRDPEVATRVLTYLGRTAGPQVLVAPSTLVRAAVANLKSLLSGSPARHCDPDPAAVDS